jgi:DNA-binding SARP family transcriptional activator
MDFRILGSLEVIDAGRPVEITGQKQRALLAVLLLHGNEVVSSDRLIDALWPERPPGTAAKALQVYVSQLRKLLGKDRVETKAPGYLLRVGEGELDRDCVRRLVDEGRLQEALALWRGRPLYEFEYEPFAQADIARLEELRLACLEQRIELDLAAGRHAAIVGELEALVAGHPLREGFRAQLMLALYRSGRQAEALEAYQAARAALVEELGIELARELRALHQAILNQDPTLDLVAQPPAEIDAGRGAFVGRDAELAELTAGLDEAFAGRGRLFLLVGEPGIGKSRLAEELIARARVRGARVLVGRCWEAGGAPAYWPWVQSLRAYVREVEPNHLRDQLGSGAVDLAQLLPELRELFLDLGEPPVLEAESARFRLFEAVTSFLIAVSHARPLVLALDDLHAADEPSLLLLQFLARELGPSRLIVVGACRDVDPTPSDPLTAVLTELAREGTTRILRLDGLEAIDTGRFIELVSGESPGGDLVALIHEETEGNPLFVGEIVRLLAQEGRLGGDASARFAIPQSVRDVIARRLSHLSDECNRILVLASVLGREFALDALAHMATVAENELLDTLDEAMAARVVADLPGSGTRLRFAHVLIRDTLYEGLTTVRRVRLHRLALEMLETAPGGDVAELAHHAIAGSDFGKGVEYARSAGDRALALLAYEDAGRLYQTALDALELSHPDDDRTRCELLLVLGDAESRAGHSLNAKAAFLQVTEIARNLGLGSQLARGAVGYGGRHVWGRAGTDRHLVPLLEEGLSVVEGKDVELKARLLARLAGALRDEHSIERRDRVSREAVELARRSAEPAALAYALDGRVTAIANPETLAECLTLAEELCEVAEQIGDAERMIYGQQCKVIALVMLGDIDRAAVDVSAMNQIAEQLRQPEALFQALAARSHLALAAGRISEAEPLIPAFFAFGEHAQPEMALPIFRLQRLTLGELRGDLQQLEPEITELVDAYPARPVFRCVLAHLDTLLGREAEARTTFRELARERFSSLPFDIEWLYGTCLLAETCARLGETATAPALYDSLAPWSALNAVDHPEAFRGSVARYLGQLAAVLGRRDDAAAHFEDALEMNERTGARPWLAYTQHDYARLLHSRDKPGDRERAGELESQALTIFGQLGIHVPEE